MTSATESARKWIGAQEGDGRGVEEWAMAENAGLPWCAGFVTQAFIESGQDGWMEGLDNRLAVDSVMNHGKSKGLNTSFSEAMPQEGSLVSFREWGHIGMVTKVTTNEKGETVYHVTHGNYSNSVVNEVFTEAEMKAKFHDEYVDSRKIDAYHQANGHNAPPLVQTAANGQNQSQFAQVFGALPTSQQVSQSLNNGNSAVNTYQQNVDAMPQIVQQMGMEGMFMQLLVALIMTAAQAQDQIPSQQQYRDNPNAGMEALENVDRQRQQQQQPSTPAVSTVSTADALSSTPSRTPIVQQPATTPELTL